MENPILVPLIDYGKRKFLTDSCDEIYLEENHIRVVGNCEYEQPKDEDEILIEEVSLDYDMVLLKDEIHCIRRVYNKETDIHTVYIDYSEESSFSFRYHTKKEAAELHGVLVKWWLK